MSDDGHYHLHTAAVSRGKGHSAVAAAAYQAGQSLKHEGQRCFAVGLEHRKTLSKETISQELRAAFQETRLFDLEIKEELAVGRVSDALRQAFEQAGRPLSDRCRIYQGDDGFTLRDRDKRASYRLRDTADGIAVSRVFKRGLSDKATVEKINRREWHIQDGNKSYRVREYRENIKDETTGKRRQVARHLDIYADRTHRYSRRKDVLDTWVQVGEHAETWQQEIAATPNPNAAQRKKLWNWAEGLEKARDGRAARAFNAALPRELDYQTNCQVVREFVEEQFTKHGLIVDVAMHDKIASDGGKNLHCHLLVTTRQIGKNGKASTTKNKYWDSRQRVHDWREAWSATVNKALEDAGSDTRIDHRSNAERGIDAEPGEHLGPGHVEMEERGIETAKGDRNRQREADNLLRELALENLDGWTVEELGESQVERDAAELNPVVNSARQETKRGARPADTSLKQMATAESTEDDVAQAAINAVLRDQRLAARSRFGATTVARSAQAVVEWSTRLRDYAINAARALADKFGIATHQRESERNGPVHGR